MQRAGDGQLVEVERRDRLRGQQRERIDADDDRDRQIAARLLRHLEEAQRVARQQQDAEPVGAAHLQAMDGDVLHAGLRIARDQQAGRDVGPAVELVVDRDRQQPRQIDLAVHDLLRGRARDLAPGQGIERGVLEVSEQAIVE